MKTVILLVGLKIHAECLVKVINELEKDLERMARSVYRTCTDYNDLSKIIKRKGK
jgi:hypothetical protein